METPTSEFSERSLYIIQELLPDDGVLINFATQAPAPSKDFAQIQLTFTEVKGMASPHYGVPYVHHSVTSKELKKEMRTFVDPKHVVNQLKIGLKNRSVLTFKGSVNTKFVEEDGTVANLSTFAPPPDKDYSKITVTTTEVIFRFWKITLRKNGSSHPVEKRESLQDFLYDERLQSEINRLFGANLLVYLRGLASGHIDYLVRLPHPLLVEIIMRLDLEDISKLAQTNKMFNKLCSGNGLWERIYKTHTKQKVSPELFSLAQAIGWRKLFFTNKIQLQVRLRRQAAIRKKKREAVAAASTLGTAQLHLQPRPNSQPPPMAKSPLPTRTPFRPLSVTFDIPGYGVSRYQSVTPTPSELALPPHLEKSPPPPISPYPEGETGPKFSNGPEDYSNYSLIDPRDGPPQLDSDDGSDEDEAIDEEAEKERLRLEKQKAYDAITVDDWGEDFSFLGDDTPMLV